MKAALQAKQAAHVLTEVDRLKEHARLDRELLDRKRKRQQEASRQRKKQRSRDPTTELDDTVKGKEIFGRLCAVEKKLDAFFVRKRMDMHNALRAQPMARNRHTLRVTVSSTAQTQGQAGAPEDGETQPTWTMKVVGRHVAQGRGKEMKFGRLVKRVFVELDPAVYPSGNTIVWTKKSPSDDGKDGFEITRPGTRDVEAKIFLHVESNPERYKLTPGLSRLLGTHTDTRVQLIHALWRYIKEGRLQDIDDPKLIHCDAALREVLNRPHLTFSEIPIVIGEHIQAPDPIAVDFTVRMNPDERQEVTVDVEVDLEDEMMRVDAANFLTVTSSSKAVQRLNHEIHDLVGDINNANSKLDLLAGFSSNPAAFMGEFVQSQEEDALLVLDGRYGPDKAHNQPSDFYAKPWAEEGAKRYLSDKIAKRRVQIAESVQKSRKAASKK